jgi:hypothetical protein
MLAGGSRLLKLLGLSNPEGVPTMIIVAHPDDETLGSADISTSWVTS